nr:sulfite exporter TauE/SafE family protein [Candidatus Nitrosacidococcus tergens]
MVGLTGVGGGSLMTPILIFGFGLSPIRAVGTDLLFAALTKIGGVWSHWHHHTIQWHVVGFLALGSIPSTIITLQVLKNFQHHDQQLTNLINLILGFALILTALALPLKDWLKKAIKANHTSKLVQVVHRLQQNKNFIVITTITIGWILGFIVTMSSIGAGALGSVALLYLYPNLYMNQLAATDIAHAVPLTIIAGIGHWHLGTVDVHVLGNLLLGSLPGVYLGSRFSINLPDRVIQITLSTLLMLIGIKFIL